MDLTLRGNRPARWLLPAAAALLMGLLFYLHSLAIYACDDFFYAAFWKGGVLHFLRENLRHFREFNGRVLVHLVCQSVLTGGSVVFAAAAVGIYLGLCRLLPRVFEPEGEERVAFSRVCCCFGLVFLLLCQKILLGKAILWISSFFNYIFPTFLILLTAAFLRRARDRGRGAVVWGSFLAFCSGATTEQSGVIALTLFGCMWLEAVLERRRPGRYTLFLVAAVLGLASVFASPATRGRAARDVSLASAANTIERIAVNTISVRRGLFLCLAFCFAMLLLIRRDRRIPRINWLFLPAGAVLLAGCFLPNHLHLCTAMLLTFLLALLVSALSLIFRSPYRMAGYYELALMAGLAVMPVTNNAAVRICLPFLFGILLLTVWLATRLLRLGWRWSTGVWLLAVLATGLSVAVPSLRAFAGNYCLERENLAAVKAAGQTGVVNYCIDYDPQCGYTWIASDGYSRRSFLALYGLEEEALQFYSAGGVPVKTGQYFPTAKGGGKLYLMDRDGVLYASLQAAVAACGGWTCRAEVDYLDFKLNGRSYLLSDRALYDGTAWVPLPAYIVCYSQAYFPVDWISEYFSIRFDLSADLVTCTLAEGTSP